MLHFSNRHITADALNVSNNIYEDKITYQLGLALQALIKEII